ncbi:uncharacterized protein FRV6_13036 [Fusarium oxysporum]|uniref:Uncharacterized protein n=1 Tax=Fusarium oxysporum TaxID=5507 RepID=A0A2H3TJR6_FUSOX|nr:uncharacterized protein FRV6_13036 [Fusarium oxysporum]
MYNPTDGHLTTIQELELTGWNLDEWLRRTDDHKGDAWAQGNTNRAFAINNFVGVERSHRANDWNNFNTHLEARGKGTYTHVAGPPTLVASISNDLTPTIVQEGNWDNSLGKAPGTFTLNYAKTQSRTVSLAVTKTAKFSTEATFALEGFTFKLSDTYDISNTAANSQTDTTTVTETVSRVLAPGEKIHYSVAQSKSTLTSPPTSTPAIPSSGAVAAGDF